MDTLNNIMPQLPNPIVQKLKKQIQQHVPRKLVAGVYNPGSSKASGPQTISFSFTLGF